MSPAVQLLQEVRRDLGPVETKIRHHPYLAAVKNGQVSREALRALPGTQYHMWQSDLRSAAHLVERFASQSYGEFFMADLHAELGAQRTIMDFAAALDMSEADLEDFEPSPKGFAYASYFAWLSQYGSAGEVACGLAVNLAAWGHNCGAVSSGLRKAYGFSSKETAFLDVFAVIPDLDKAAAEIIAEDLEQGVSPRRIKRAARLIQAYEAAFWDAMAEAAGVPLHKETEAQAA